MRREPECPLIANRGLQGTELTDRRLLGIPMHDDGRRDRYIGTRPRKRYTEEPRVMQHARLSRRVLDAIGEGRADVALLWLARANAADGAEREYWIARLEELIQLEIANKQMAFSSWDIINILQQHRAGI